MLVLQQIKVLPAGAQIIIKDQDKRVLDFSKSFIDGSLKFITANDANLYDKVYSTFKVYGLEAVAYKPTVTFKNCDRKETEIIYLIQIRGESDEG